MIRTLLRFTLILTLIAVLLMAAGLVIGRGIDTTITVALVSPVNSSGMYITPTQLVLFDLKRSLRDDQHLPLENVNYTSFERSDSAAERVVFATFRAPGNNSEPGGLYIYNFFNGQLTTVFKNPRTELATDSNADTRITYPMFSPDERKLAYINPLDKLPYLFDTETGETTPIAFKTVDPLEGVNWNWSLDGKKLSITAVRSTTDVKTLYIVEVDPPDAGRAPVEIPLPSADAYTIWSGDSRYVQLQRSGGNSQTMNFPMTILDTTDGSEHPFTKGLQASSSFWFPWWGCDNRWLTYTVVTDEVREGYILDMQDGTMVRVNDVPALADESIEMISPTPNCRQFLVVGERIGETGRRTSLEENTRHTYLFDLATNTAEFIGDIAVFPRLMTDNILYYVTPDVDNNRWQVFRRSLDPLGEPVLVSQYDPASTAYFQWAPDMTLATYTETTPQTPFGGRLRRLDGVTGQTFPLTSDDEVVLDYVQFNASDRQKAE